MSQNNLQALGAHIRGKQDRSLQELESNESTRRFLGEHVAQRVQERSKKTNGLWLDRRLWAPLAVAACAALGLLGARSILWPALEFRVGHVGQASEQVGVLRNWSEAPADATLPLRFSDGTRVDLEPHARARVVAIGRAGADIVLESGRAHVDVVPTTRLPGESAWRIDSGPFSVEVKGTRFDVSWDPRADEFALDLFEGVVTVQGCGQATAVRVVAGQGVRASCTKQQWALGAIKEMAAAPIGNPETDNSAAVKPAEANGTIVERTPPEVLQPEQSPDTTTSRATSRAASRADVNTTDDNTKNNTRESPSWQALAREGKYAEAYSLAASAGFSAACEHSSAEDLLLLGNAARLSNNPAHAADAYGAARRRFAGTAEAARAAYSLGRLQVRTNKSEAERWFETYLREEPRGPFSQAASDWLFELAIKGGTIERQRQRARTYLDRHPTGAHADDARRLLEQSPSAP